MTTKQAQYTTFVEGAWPRLFRTAYALTGNYDEAEEMLQATLTKVYVSWSRVARASTPDAYVRRMLVNQVISWRRRPAYQAEITSAAPPERHVDGHEVSVTESSALWEALSGLPPRQRAVLVLRFYEDLSERDIAAVLGIAPGTVKSQCSAALGNLRASLGSQPAISTGDQR